MASSRARSSDIKLIVCATVAVLLAGFFIAGAAFVATRSGGSVVCGLLNIGSATDVRQRSRPAGPTSRPAARSCGFWLALDNGNIVAYKVAQPQHCALQLKRDHWECGGTTVDAAGLAQYPVSIQTVGQTDSVVVDLVPPGVDDDDRRRRLRRVRRAPAAPTTTAASSRRRRGTAPAPRPCRRCR